MTMTALHTAIAASGTTVEEVYLTAIKNLNDKDDVTMMTELMGRLKTEKNVAVLASFVDVAGSAAKIALDTLGKMVSDCLKPGGGGLDRMKELFPPLKQSIPKLVEMLDVEANLNEAAVLLKFMAACDSTNQDIIREAGGIAKLAHVVPSFPKTDTQLALTTVWQVLYDNLENQKAFLEADGANELFFIIHELAKHNAPPSKYEGVKKVACMNDSIKAEVVERISRYTWSSRPPPIFAREVDARCTELRREYRKRTYESMGADFTPPKDFLCAITNQVMKRPVIASDGHCYDHDNIQKVLDEGGVSPVTQAKLHADTFPNLQLQMRIADHHDAVIREFENQKRAELRGACSALSPHEVAKLVETMEQNGDTAVKRRRLNEATEFIWDYSVLTLSQTTALLDQVQALKAARADNVAHADTRLVEKETEQDDTHPRLWFCDREAPVGRIPYKFSDVPICLRRALEPRFIPNTVNGLNKFKHVVPQSGSRCTKGKEPDGWQVQFTVKGGRTIYRVCSTVCEENMGALLVAAARLDALRLDVGTASPHGFSTRNRVDSWIRHMVENGEPAAKRWLEEMGILS